MHLVELGALWSAPGDVSLLCLRPQSAPEGEASRWRGLFSVLCPSTCSTSDPPPAGGAGEGWWQLSRLRGAEAQLFLPPSNLDAEWQLGGELASGESQVAAPACLESQHRGLLEFYPLFTLLSPTSSPLSLPSLPLPGKQHKPLAPLEARLFLALN